jgi:mannose-6-phosphate isomerase
MLTVRDEAVSIIENGEYKNTPLDKYLNCGESDFPLLVKLIDAGDKLSIQVHPNKTELWYVIDAEENAQIVYGFKKAVTKSEIREAINNNTLEELLNYATVKPGEFYYIPTGLIHAIGGGILVAEIQQNNNTTYRVYDYGRKQADGTLRELHVDKAIDAIVNFSADIKDTTDYKYFTVQKYITSGNFTIETKDAFSHIICVDGGGSLNLYDSYYVPPHSSFNISSEKSITVLVSTPASKQLT